ncbi:hypothetical protein BaRGS_00033080, partial [Batillaria attramentaria]
DESTATGPENATVTEDIGVRRELDMIFTKEQWEFIIRQNRTNSTQGTRNRRKALRPMNRWPGGVLPYERPSGRVFSGREIVQIEEAMKEWQTYTCLQFRQATSRDSNRLHFISGDGCYSYIGVVKRRQEISLGRGCRHKGIIAHEIGHAAGYVHEQSRPDRDRHVTIVYENIQRGNEDQFRKYRWADTFGVAYDYRSIMHYGARDFSRNGDYTIRTKDPSFQRVIGNRESLSFRDIKLANLLYECRETAGCDPNIKCPGEGFVDKSCTCMCPGNPVRPCNSGDTGTGSRFRARAGAATGTDSVPGACTDRDPLCGQYARLGHCTTNGAFMADNCSKTCRNCSPQQESIVSRILRGWLSQW